MEKVITIVPAAGLGSRLGLGKNKAFADVGGLPLLVQCLRMLADTGCVSKVIAVVRPQEVVEAETLLTEYQTEYYPRLPFIVVAGGKERQDSVANALAVVTESDGFIAVHDGARPFAGKEVFERVLQAAAGSGAAIAAVPVKDTIKVVDENSFVQATPVRNTLRAVQTPQIFKISVLKQAYELLQKQPENVTDDASLVERLGIAVTVAEGSYENIKVTTPEDLRLAENLCKSRGLEMTGKNNSWPQFRVGCGYDVHKLEPDRKLILCGLEIPYELGLLGHSDADVALHALMDALLGAAGLGDIGRHFPDTDIRFKDADSMLLLVHVVKLLHEQGWQINNADVTIMAQKPKLAPYIEQMAANIARAMQVERNAVNVKATTTEKLGFVGRGEGMASEAVVSIVRC